MADRAGSVGVVKYTKQGGTYYMRLVSDFGDVVQKYASYDESSNKASGIVPDFTVSGQQPTIEVYITNSKVTSSSDSGEVYPNGVVWEALGQTLAFGSNGISTNSFNGETGHFQKIDANKAKKQRAGLKIVKNLVVASNATTIQIDATATIANGVGSTKVKNSYFIPISQNTQNGTIVRISASNGGILDKDHPSVTLTANVEDTGGGNVSDATYIWSATNSKGEMEALDGQTSKTLTVTQEMVDNARIFKLEVPGKGTDAQVVYDQTDELRIVPNPTPVTEDIADSAELKVTWNPKLFRGETLIGDTSNSKITWGMNFYSPAGLPVKTATKYCITADEYDQQGGANYIITAEY